VIEQSLTKVHREWILLKQLDSIKTDYDVVLLDCPPNLSLTSVNAMMAAPNTLDDASTGKYKAVCYIKRRFVFGG